MLITHGEIIPGIKLGDIRLGITKKELLMFIGKEYIEHRYNQIIEIENAVFTFKNERLCQICVTHGFKDAFHNIFIGSTMQDVQRELGNWENQGASCSVWQPLNYPGICFELGDYGDDVDDWDEMIAPIEWICIYEDNTGDG